MDDRFGLKQFGIAIPLKPRLTPYFFAMSVFVYSFNWLKRWAREQKLQPDCFNPKALDKKQSIIGKCFDFWIDWMLRQECRRANGEDLTMKATVERLGSRVIAGILMTIFWIWGFLVWLCWEAKDGLIKGFWKTYWILIVAPLFLVLGKNAKWRKFFDNLDPERKA